ncbi:MFS transporter [Streptomyces sp. GESEQ-35]|uniref:MFS transporter n=1 Tax=Streptomyces sp. GESEQ-35 TaxID=2812657 RepID=UPI001B338E8E|nr:MFS transporter [Streptomyces sp. GESEQ-35]
MKRLVPLLLLMYAFAYIDRSNVGFAKDELSTYVAISDAAFALGASLFFIPYILFEVPSNMFMKKVGARIWMCRIMVTWGLASAAMMFVQNEGQFYGLRALLGLFEAGFFPGAILYLTFWFPDRYRASVMGLFYIATPLSFIFGSPLSGLLLKFHGLGGLHGYQWMFFIEGVAASAIGVLAFFYLKDQPKDASWLTGPEKAALQAQIDAEQELKQAHSGARTFLAAFRTPTVWYFGLLFLTVQLVAAQVTFYLPTQIADLLGTSVGLKVGLLVAVPWTCALVATVLVPRYASRSGRQRSTACIAGLVAAVGLFLSTITPTGAALAILCAAIAGLWALQPTFWSLLTDRIGGLAAVTGIALVNSIGNIGNFLSPNLRTWADDHLTGTPGVAIIAVLAVLGALMFMGVSKAPLEELAEHDLNVPTDAVTVEGTATRPSA